MTNPPSITELELLARFNRAHVIAEDHGAFLHALYLLLREAPASVSTWAKQRAFESAADTKNAWRVVAISEAAIALLCNEGAGTKKLRRGHFFSRRQRFNQLFDTSRAAWDKDELLRYFFEHDACALITAQENGRSGVEHWSRLHAVPPHIFTSTGFNVRVRKRLDMPWVQLKAAEVGLGAESGASRG